MTSKLDRSFAAAQRSYDAMEAPDDECEGRALNAADRRALARIRAYASPLPVVDADADDIAF